MRIETKNGEETKPQVGEKSFASSLPPQTSNVTTGMADMKMIQEIPLHQIDLLDETFSVNFMPDLRSLRSSIREIGLIQPVLLRKRKGAFQIICGFRRISILRELGNDKLPAMVFEERERDDLHLFIVCLHENMMARGFHAVEKAIALEKLIDYFDVDRSVIIQSYLPLFSLEPNEKILSTYLSLARMEEDTRRYVLREEVSRSNIRILSALAPDDRIALIPFLSSLKLGENRLREVLTILDEICRRDRVGLKEMIHRTEIQAILSREELTPVQKTERLKRVLMDLRYPKMKTLEEGFEKMRKALHLPAGVSLNHSPYFEGRELEIDFQFQSMEEYRSFVSSLSSLADKKEFEEMIQGSRIRSTKFEIRNNLK